MNMNMNRSMTMSMKEAKPNSAKRGDLTNTYRGKRKLFVQINYSNSFHFIWFIQSKLYK